MNQNTLSNLIPAVLAYFQGERREMLLILAGSVTMAALVIVFYLSTRDGFARGLMISVLASATLLSGAAIGLLVRDSKLNLSLVAGLTNAGAPVAAQQERGRIETVVANYPRYRWAAAAIGLAALVMLVLSRQPWMHGVATGLLLLVMSQIVIDHYSERRATTYLDQLSHGTTQPRGPT